jgi:hypothetical protein
MKKTDKKIENTLTKALTEVCEVSLKEVAGFSWITHLVNYRRFPESLAIICVFNTQSELAAAIVTHQDTFMRSLIGEKLRAAGIQVTDIHECVQFDTEEACDQENGGNWQQRLS